MGYNLSLSDPATASYKESNIYIMLVKKEIVKF